MFNKKYILILLLLIVGICAISAASAADVSDAIASDNGTDVVAADEANANEIATDIKEDTLEKTDEVNDGEKLSANDDVSVLTLDETNEKISTLPYSFYSVSFKYDEISIESNKAGRIDVYIDPCTYMDEAYHYSYCVYDKDMKLVFEHEVSASSATKGYYYYNIPANSIVPGAYLIAAKNSYDGVTKDTAILKVSGTAVIKTDNYKSVYMSNAKMTARIIDQLSEKPLSSAIVKVVFTKGKTSVTKYYLPNSNGYISFAPPVGVGTWSVTFSSGFDYVSAASVKRTAVITKAPVKIVAKKVYEYKGFKVKLKAIVKSNGKKVKEGKVVFKIRGKKFYAKVKNGVATKKVKLYKIKKYYYSATFLGTKNLYKSKKSVSTAKMYKRHRVKIYAPNPSLYVGQKKYFTIKVRTADGKKVKNGWLKIQSRDGYSKAKVKNGKVKVIAYTNLADVYVKSKGDDSIYKKSVSKKFKIKYIPGSHKYKKATTKYWATTKFKCHCGKTYTHSHTYYDYYGYLHLYKIIVI